MKIIRFLIFTMLITLPNSVISEHSSLQDELEAAFIYKFIKFIEWNDSSHINFEDNICVGILGEGPMKRALRTIEGKEVHGNKINISHFDNISEIGECKVIYISPDYSFDIGLHLEKLQKKNILTIGHKKNFAIQGGIINFIRVNNKINFEINLEQAKKSNIRISSKLLHLARIVGSNSF